MSSFDSTAAKVVSDIGTLYESFTDKSHVTELSHAYKPRVTSKIYLQEACDDDSQGT